MSTATMTSASAVSRTLRKAGHVRSGKVTGRVRGYHSWTRGVHVTQSGLAVRVTFHTGRAVLPADWTLETAHGLLDSAQQDLEAAGYVVERGEQGRSVWLVVRSAA